MKTHLIVFALAASASFAVPATARAQHHHHTSYHSHHQHGAATTRHCQTDYDHRPHTYHSGSHYHYCPGGGHVTGGGHVHGGVRRVSNYDPVVAEIQRTLQNSGHYAHGHQQADGIYGPETAGAIRSFQQSKGLPVTGMIDGALMTALGLSAPTYVQPGAVQAIQVTSTGAPTAPPGYKLVPVDPPKVEVPPGYKLVPADR